MIIAIQMSEEEELRALPIILRHLPGKIVADRIYLLDPSTIELLRNANIMFREVGNPGPRYNTNYGHDNLS